MKLVIIDNYDSFTYNLVQYFQEIIGTKVDVLRNDVFKLEDLEGYDLIVLSPGPGLPEEAGLLMEVIKTYAGRIPIFGVCLGLQAIVEHFGGTLKNLDDVMHGVDSLLYIKEPDLLFDNLDESSIMVGRYHSWVADTETFPSEALEVTAIDSKGEIMALRGKNQKICAVQFHPESILTPTGKQMLTNLVNAIREGI